MSSPCRTLEGECRSCQARFGRLFCDLPDAALADFERNSRPVVYPKGAILVAEGQEARGVYVVCSGRVKLVATSAEGRSLITQLVEPGEAIGLSAVVSGREVLVSARALETTSVKFVTKSDFLEFLRAHGEVGFRVARHIANSYHCAHNLVRSIALSSSASEKLARLVIDRCDKEGVRVEAGIRVRFTLTHEEVAQMIGASRETVTRALGSLRRQEIVSQRGAFLLVRDPERLAALAQAEAAPQI